MFISRFKKNKKFPRGEIIGEFPTKKTYYSDWLKIFGEFFRHEKFALFRLKSKQTKVRMLSRFLQRIRRWFRLVEIRLKG